MRLAIWIVMAALLICGAVPAEAAQGERLNVLMITVDDMNWDSIGAYGCTVDDITPNLDKLAAQGMRFERAHVTVAICMPCRAVWMTGRYPHNSGALGFDRINPGVPTMPETLRQAGYFTGVMAKNAHVIPSRHATAFDVNIPASQLGNGREPSLYHQHVRQFLEAAKQAGKPFFLMANSQDPHRPFAGSQQERDRGEKGRKGKKGKKAADADEDEGGDGSFPAVRRTYRPDEVTVPRFLPELPDVRQEMAEYYTSVHRADETVGAILRALDEAGMREKTVVFFMSDHGMPLPFAKTNAYHHSTKTPLIVRWPGVVRPGSVEERAMVNGIDFAPTVLDLAGLPNFDGADGRSFRAVLEGEEGGRDHVYTHINTISSKRSYPMRKVQDRTFAYIYNGWADGQTVFRNESQNGLTMKAMERAAAQDQSIAARVELFLHRVPEELYDVQKDPDALQNLIDHPDYREQVKQYRALLLKEMESSGDPQLQAYRDYLRGKE